MFRLIGMKATATWKSLRTTEHGNGIRMALAINSPMVVCWFVGLLVCRRLPSCSLVFDVGIHIEWLQKRERIL